MERTAIVPDKGLVVAALCEESDQVGESVVDSGGGTVFLKAHELRVYTLVGWDFAPTELQTLQDRIPHWGVVHARLPGVADVGEPFALRVTLPVEVPMPRRQMGKRFF